ncbi:hypothetical protein PK35_06645 [Tamlana nanhaiensis]|uniref:Thioredoxin domain-containing protein n=1 Tax=Neotamlana nanhaiensis TaxID=1382798 RepID=A0A0D7W317_9FLAO|nr:thioredoxin-like domain-containing protein [Tamlana nanhaiensis]KJD33520.1 hypothetical protein PK35_06645 [Tamlana nanhaiensis]
MIKTTTIKTTLLNMLFMAFTSQAFSQNKLPESISGEWYTESSSQNYKGVLIHQDFIEYGYSAFVFQEVNKVNDSTYSFSAKDNLERKLKGEITVINKDSIKLKRGDSPVATYVSRELPSNSEHSSWAEVPDTIKNTWYTTDGENNLEFDLTNNQFIFRGQSYNIENVIAFNSNSENEYRFVVKRNRDYRMFYFKKWGANYTNIGFNGAYGALYKVNKTYPNTRIKDLEGYMASIVPMELRGDWLHQRGSNLWSHSFYYNYAVVDKAIWKYKTVKQKGKRYVLILEKDGTEKIIYAKPNKGETVSFAFNKNKFEVFGKSKVDNPNFKLDTQETLIEGDVVNYGTATYSGIITNFSDSDQKTGSVAVDNVFTGNQDSYIIEIKEDGSFSVEFPSYHLQQIYVTLPGFYNTVFVEPGKTTWQFINSNDRTKGYFAGDLKQLNTDFASLNHLVFNNQLNNLTRNVKTFTPQGFKSEAFKIVDNQIAQVDSVSKHRFVSKQAQQLLRQDLTYRSYMLALGYDMYNNTPYQDSANIDKTFTKFITPEILNNKSAVLASSYSSFLNRLRFLRHVRKDISVTHPNFMELVDLLQTKNVSFSEDDEDLIKRDKKFREENAAVIKRRDDFNAANMNMIRSVGQKIGALYQKLNEEERKEIFNGSPFDLDKIEALSKTKKADVTFTHEEREYHEASKNLITKEEQAAFKAFYTEATNSQIQAFMDKYKSHIDNYVKNQLQTKMLNTIQENYGDTFSAKVLMAQEVLGNLSRTFVPFTEDELKETQQKIHDSLISNVIEIENDKLIAKIEANKNKEGFIANNTPKTEADKVFDAIISKYKGNVLYVDFWATWCGPCRNGIKRIAPLKEDFKDKEVAFIYITNPSSPETTYDNMIPDIKGEHYRVSQDQWNYLQSKFNITGIPHYLLIDKSGNVVKDNTSDLRSPEKVKVLLNSYLK